MSEAAVLFGHGYALHGTLDSLYALEAPLVARLLEQVPGLNTVASSSVIAGSNDITPLLPALFVEPGGATQNAGGEGYGIGSIKQRWSVMVVVPHWRMQPGDDSAAQQAGPIALQAIAALNGWTPSEYIEPLVFTGHADPVSGAGWAAFELNFETELTL